MNKNKSIFATLLTVIGSIIVAIISNIDKFSGLIVTGIWVYFIPTIIIIGMIWLMYGALGRQKKGHISDHPIFTQFMYWERYLSKTFKLKDIGKSLLFREILNVHIKSFKNSLITLHDDTKDINNIIEFKNKHICILYQIIDKLEKHFYTETYSEEDKKILKLIIPKFNEWCGSSYDLVIDRIEEICDSNLYIDNISRNVVILLSYQIMLSLIILNASKTLNELNGELSGLNFKGVLIQ